MNKSELISEIAERADVSKSVAARVLEATTGAIEGALSTGESVTLIGFGTFDVSYRAARTGRNPQTGAPLEIAASTLPRFKPGKSLKDAVA